MRDKVSMSDNTVLSILFIWQHAPLVYESTSEMRHSKLVVHTFETVADM